MLGCKQLKNTLIQISDDSEQTTKTRCDVNNLFNHICMFETVIYNFFRIINSKE